MQPERMFGYWMKQRRKSLDITQEQLARQIGCSLQLISKIEAGARRPSKQVAQLLLKELQAPLGACAAS